MSDTPRADAAFEHAVRDAVDSAEPIEYMRDYSRQLERELAVTRESLALSQSRVRDLEDMLEDASVIPRQPDVEGTP